MDGDAKAGRFIQNHGTSSCTHILLANCMRRKPTTTKLLKECITIGNNWSEITMQCKIWVVAHGHQEAIYRVPNKRTHLRHTSSSSGRLISSNVWSGTRGRNKITRGLVGHVDGIQYHWLSTFIYGSDARLQVIQSCSSSKSKDVTPLVLASILLDFASVGTLHIILVRNVSFVFDLSGW